MCIEGIPKNSQDILADLAHPQQDGTFEHSIGFEPHIWFTKPALYQLSYRVHCARFLLTFVERSFSIWRPDRVESPCLEGRISLRIMWRLLNSNQLLRIFSPPHRPSLPNLQLCCGERIRTRFDVLARFASFYPL